MTAAAEQRIIHSQASWVIRSNEVELAVTQAGAHMAPVTFYRSSGKPVQPYHITPWQDEGLKFDVPILAPLRGDWLCLPFGGNGEPFRGEQHPPHGETSGSSWQLAGSDANSVTLSLETTARSGRVTRQLSLIDGQNVVYSSETIEGFAGPAPVGHHATLNMPEKEGSVRIATSAMRFAMTNPTQFSNPANGEYQSLAIGARFTDLAKVPLLFKGAADADLTSLPARKGFCDLLQLCNEPGDIAWTTVTRGEDGYLWFALKDPALLNSTILWIENHGRHGGPWNGRNHCLGMEDATAYFADGLAAAAQPNLLNKEGVKTAIEFRADHPTVIRYIQGVAKIPAGFEQVQTVEFAEGQVTFVATTGERVSVPVKHEFLKSGKL